jgi:SPP1 gp7 family putative phage head morphogenesis protein
MPTKRNRKALLDLAIRRQVLLERIKAGQYQDFAKVFPEIERLISAKVGGLANDLAGENRKFLSSYLSDLESDLLKAYGQSLKLFSKDLEETAGIFAAMEAGDIAASITGTVKLSSPTARQAFNLAKVQAMSHSGETLENFIETLAQGETKRVVSAIRKGYFQGRTNQELVREILGTRARRFQDGILNVSRRNAQAVVFTSVQHVASVGRMRTWQDNADVVKGYEWVSTLDRRTSEKCQSLDGQKFEVGKGPVPPIHVRCRSTTVATLDPKYDFLSEGRTRSSETGPVDAKKNYYDWLKEQDPEFQNQALGPTKGKLFREGGLTPKKFSDLNLDKNFEPMSLDEMQEIEPDAFKKAKINTGERNSPVQRDAGDSGRDAPGASEAIRHNIGTGPQAGEDLFDQNWRESNSIIELEREGSFTVRRDPEKFLGEGAEHTVAINPQGDRVIKHTKGGFGVTLEGVQAPMGSFVDLRDATPSEYLRRIDLSNKLWGDDTQLIGVDLFEGKPSLVTSQRFIRGAMPSQAEIDSLLESKGYKKVDPTVFGNDYISDKTWVHPDGFVIADTKPANFVKDSKGDIFPVDTIVQQVERESPLWGALGL